MNAGTVIDEARDLHPSFDPQTHPDKICLRFLSRWQDEMLARALGVYPELLDDGLTTVALPLADFDAGYALTSPLALEDVEVIVGTSRYPLTLLSHAARFDPQPMYAGWVINQTLFLSGTANDWSHVTELRVRYKTQPVPLTALADVLVLPDSAKNAATYAVASFMAGRQISRTAGVDADPKYFMGLRMDAEKNFLEALWLLDSATTHTIRDVM